MAGVIIVVGVFGVSIIGACGYRYCISGDGPLKAYCSGAAEVQQEGGLEGEGVAGVDGITTSAPAQPAVRSRSNSTAPCAGSQYTNIRGHGQLPAAAAVFNSPPRDRFSQLSISTASAVELQPDDSYIAMLEVRLPTPTLLFFRPDIIDGYIPLKISISHICALLI
jgi:hypothetical protein